MDSDVLPSTLPQLLAEVVRHNRDRDAVVTDQRTLTYEQLDRETERMARALMSLGVGKGTRLAVLAPDGLLWITTFLAGLRIGALTTAISTLCSPRELGHILRHGDIQVLVGARRFLRHDYAEKLVQAVPGIAGSAAGSLFPPEAPYLRSVWLDDCTGLPWAQSIEELTARADGAEAPSGAVLRLAEREVVPSDDAVVVYTSGSTSLPKAVVHSQWTVARHPPELAKLFLLKGDDRMMPLLPAFWLGGMAMALEVLSTGATLVYPPSPATEDVLASLQKHRVNRVNGWGDMLTKLREAAVESGIDIDAIVGLGPFRDAQGELIPPQLQSNMLGMSETFAPHSAEPLNCRLPAAKAGASGRAVNGYERRVVDPETGVDVQPGETGELLLRGGALMSGLYKIDRRDVFTETGFYRTGDLCRLDSDGYLYFVARKGDMIKTRAANVSRLEVEEALRQLPEVDSAFVTGLEDAEFGQRVVAAVVPAPGHEPAEAALKEALRPLLSSYKIPKNIVLVTADEIPRTATGKVKLFEVASLIAGRMRSKSAQ